MSRVKFKDGSTYSITENANHPSNASYAEQWFDVWLMRIATRSLKHIQKERKSCSRTLCNRVGLYVINEHNCAETTANVGIYFKPTGTQCLSKRHKWISNVSRLIEKYTLFIHVVDF